MSSTDLGEHGATGPWRASASSSSSPELPAAQGMGLEIRGVSRAYGATKAVDDISLSVAPGEVVSLLQAPTIPALSASTNATNFRKMPPIG